MRKPLASLLVLVCAFASVARAQSASDETTKPSWREFSLNDPAFPVQLRGYVELGPLFFVAHSIQQSRDGTRFDHVREGGQNTAFFFWRISAELEIVRHHTIVLLYQPVDVRTSEPLRRDVTVDGLTFPAGTPMRYRYGFDFYRISYLYDFLKSPRHEIAIGLSLQLRVANIEWASLDGTLARQSQNLGPVPILKVRGRYTFASSAFFACEIDGIGIQFPSQTGSVLGVLVDASLRAGYSPAAFVETFVNVRYLGGGARGPGQRPEGGGDGYVDNFFHTLSFSVGVGMK